MKESVNNVLTELDWRTYANAEKKRDVQIQQFGRNATDKGGKRLTHLRNELDYAASDVLTSKYAQRYNNGNPTNNADVYTKNGYQSITTNNFDRKVEDYMLGKTKYTKDKGWQ